MGGGLWYAAAEFAPWFTSSHNLLERAGALTVLVGAGLLLYAALILATGAVRIGQLRRMLRRGA